ncbi:ornithine cyclodeaminase family protein [Denitrobaculum tricleocarpae]|uniref:Ornithine cyclodeaminase family protein n=1 Tax=Denitrobaculum tricleocarpae TaxID=2591009 RepID=A0A545T7V8_9PROT|nr:NAD(P)-binding domain-containing protein [Denitrobaculum tricleocarpae]TQV73316.1 ornithine cyclodeaminase family protein [Denitrobaculum tricleocarpae]
MRVIALDEIQPLLDKAPIIDAVRESIILHSRGEIETPAPIQMLFGAEAQDLRGDCHVKSALSAKLPYFCIKVATGFYGNPARGLEVNNGLLLLLSAETGVPIALLQDQGYLTSARTAAAGALAASVVVDATPQRLGVIGTGQQADQQARWISAHVGISQITIFGRDASKAAGLAERLNDSGRPCLVAGSAAELCAQSDIIVTTTPASTPVLQSSDIEGGKHIIAVGADSPGKNELDPEILARAETIITDDHKQALHHGEFGVAVRAGLVEESGDLPLGRVLEDPAGFTVGGNTISVVDLTGLGAQDLAVASLLYERLSKSHAPL